MSHLKLKLFGFTLLATALASASGAATLDEGKLDPAWFGGVSEFREADEIDYLWVAPGFALDGMKVRFVEWPEPEFLGPKASERDAGDQRLARQMNSTMHELFRDAFAGAFGGRIQVVDSGEDLRIEGRIVDCSTGAVAAKVLVGFGAGSGSTTVDVRFVDGHLHQAKELLGQVADGMRESGARMDDETAEALGVHLLDLSDDLVILEVVVPEPESEEPELPRRVCELRPHHFLVRPGDGRLGSSTACQRPRNRGRRRGQHARLDKFAAIETGKSCRGAVH